MHSPPTPPDGNSGHAVAAVPTGKPALMLIDDSLAVRLVLQSSFARIGLHLDAFPDGISAIRALAQHEVQVPNLLLLDIGMPRMNGYEVATILRGQPDFKNTIIIMLSGHDGVVDRFRSRMLGARDFIPKPFRVSYVLNLVLRYLQGAPPRDEDLTEGSSAAQAV